MRLDEAERSLVNKHVRLDGMLADRAAGKNVTCRANTFLARSIPTVRIAMDLPFRIC